eukprot:6174045-Pleurochrysis_carterae.AAC.1
MTVYRDEPREKVSLLGCLNELGAFTELAGAVGQAAAAPSSVDMCSGESIGGLEEVPFGFLWNGTSEWLRSEFELRDAELLEELSSCTAKLLAAYEGSPTSEWGGGASLASGAVESGRDLFTGEGQVEGGIEGVTLTWVLTADGRLAQA